MTQGRSQQERTLRIIGGNWRSRKVSFPDRPDIRPTPDRVRETLYNWLQYDIAGARCLELYAGSGILGMEALSRSADFVTFIDRDSETIKGIAANLDMLDAGRNRFECLRSNADEWALGYQGDPYDIIFLDPPFASNDLDRILPALCTGVLGPDGLIYIETGRAIMPADLPGGLEIRRQKRAGQVHYALLCTRRDGLI